MHLAVIALGTTSVVLHAKIEGTMYNHDVLPAMNLTEVIKEDLLLSQ